MSTSARIIRIGNSRGVRLPRHVLETSGLVGDVVIEARPGEVVLRPATHARVGWDAAFAEMAARGDDALIDGDTASEFERDEWRWP